MTKTDPKPRPRVAILRGPFLNSFEMQTYELLKGEFDITAFTPHQTYFDTSGIDLPQESLWCPIAGKTPFEREKRKWQALRDRLTGRTHSFCGLRDRLEGFDLYHIMDQYFCFSYEAALAKRRHGGKLVVTQYENIPFLNDHKAMERQIKRSVREQADLFLAMSGGAREVLLQEGVPEPKIEPFSGAVDTKRFCPGARDRALARELGLTGASFTLLYVGRLAKSKGVFTLLKAAEVLAREDAGFRLLLVGKDEEGVGDWVAQRGLERCVRLAGFVAYPQMPRYYRLADAFVLPSLPTKGWKEQFGYVLVEAMACGVPALGSDCGAIPEVIGAPEQVFEPGSEEGLMKVIRALRARPKALSAKKARARALRVYSNRVVAARLAAIYRGLLDGNRPFSH